jgi:hypothetical protein
MQSVTSCHKSDFYFNENTVLINFGQSFLQVAGKKTKNQTFLSLILDIKTRKRICEDIKTIKNPF